MSWMTNPTSRHFFVNNSAGNCERNAARQQEAEDKKSTVIISAYGDMSNIRNAMSKAAVEADGPTNSPPREALLFARQRVDNFRKEAGLRSRFSF